MCLAIVVFFCIEKGEISMFITFFLSLNIISPKERSLSFYDKHSFMYSNINLIIHSITENDFFFSQYKNSQFASIHMHRNSF